MFTTFFLCYIGAVSLHRRLLPLLLLLLSLPFGLHQKILMRYRINRLEHSILNRLENLLKDICKLAKFATSKGLRC